MMDGSLLSMEDCLARLSAEDAMEARETVSANAVANASAAVLRAERCAERLSAMEAEEEEAEAARQQEVTRLEVAAEEAAKAVSEEEKRAHDAYVHDTSGALLEFFMRTSSLRGSRRTLKFLGS